MSREGVAFSSQCSVLTVSLCTLYAYSWFCDIFGCHLFLPVIYFARFEDNFQESGFSFPRVRTEGWAQVARLMTNTFTAESSQWVDPFPTPISMWFLESFLVLLVINLDFKVSAVTFSHLPVTCLGTSETCNSHLHIKMEYQEAVWETRFALEWFVESCSYLLGHLFLSSPKHSKVGLIFGLRYLNR